MLITDFIATWCCTFTGHELVVMTSERPVTFFFYFFAANIILNSAFNSAGYGLQFFYCIFFEGGSYSSGKVVQTWHFTLLTMISTNINTPI